MISYLFAELNQFHFSQFVVQAIANVYQNSLCYRLVFKNRYLLFRTYNPYLFLSIQMLKEDLPKEVINFGNATMTYFLVGEAMLIQVISTEDENIYWTTLSHDTIPQPIKILFPDPKSVFQFFRESTEGKQISLPSSNKIVLLFKIGKNTRQFPIYLSTKELTAQEKLVRKVQTLQKQLQKQRQKHTQQLNLHTLDIQNKQNDILVLRMRIQELEDYNSKFTIQKENTKQQNESLKERIRSLEQSKKALECEVTNLNGIVASQTMIIEQMERDMKESRELMGQITGSNNKTQYGQLLVFQPAPNSINRDCFTLANRLLTKNINSKDGTGKMISSAFPIPKFGRFHYKFINRNIGQHPNFRIGLISRADVAKQAYMNAGEADAIMYYCYNSDQYIIYEGVNKLEGFKISKGTSFTIVIDQQRKHIEWYVQEHFMNTSKFTQPMKMSENLHFFIQLWNNGDSLQIVDH